MLGLYVRFMTTSRSCTDGQEVEGNFLDKSTEPQNVLLELNLGGGYVNKFSMEKVPEP